MRPSVSEPIMLRRGLRTVLGDMLHLGAIRKERQKWGLRSRELCRMWRRSQVTTGDREAERPQALGETVTWRLLSRETHTSW